MEESTGKIGFDRSRMRILLCDKDPVTAQEVKDLLCRCSYQVSVVKTARQVVEVLNIAESKVDIVLSEVELPNDRGFKMLKHIVKTDSFKHIPIVMMSARDEMAIVVKCLRLGAADYLVKPLRINELLNLWTHMWRRRRMLGLTERHIVKGQLAGKNIIAEILVSDTSESNTISTDILSEDSNDAKFKAKESNLRSIPEEQDEASPELELSLTPLSKFSKVSKAVEAHNQTAERKRLSPPRRNKLKLGQSSAFLSYTKAINRASNTEKPETTTATTSCTERYDVQRSNPSEERADETPAASEGAHLAASEGTLAAPEGTHFQQEPPPPWNTANQVAQINNAVYGRPHLMSPPVMLTHSVHPSALMQPALHYYQPAQPDVSMNMAPAAAFSYYPFPIHMTSQQVGPWRALPPPGSVPERKLGVAERREAALNKFRQKRKDRCYEKKIRYASRKRLAEQRPRIKGQFVRRTEDYEEEEEDDDELSPESGVEVTQ